MTISRLLLFLATASLASVTIACGDSAQGENASAALESAGDLDAGRESTLTLDSSFFKQVAVCEGACASRPAGERLWRSESFRATDIGAGQFTIEFLEPMPALGNATHIPTRRARLTTDIPGVLPGEPRITLSRELVLEGRRPTPSMGNTAERTVEKSFEAEVTLATSPSETSTGERKLELRLSIYDTGRVSNAFLRASHLHEAEGGELTLTTIYASLTPGARPAPPPPSEECWVDHVGDECPSNRERIP